MCNVIQIVCIMMMSYKEYAIQKITDISRYGNWFVF
jgi:hypothetical protein